MPFGFQTMSDNSLRNRTWAGSFKSPHWLSCLEFALWKTVLFTSAGDGPRVSRGRCYYFTFTMPGGFHVPSPGGRIEGGVSLGQWRRMTREISSVGAGSQLDSL